MPNINSYPTITATSGDLVLISDVSSTGNPTKTATAESIAQLADFNFNKTSITNAQISALNTTPVTLIGAPGVGKVIVPMSIIANFKYGTAAMTVNTTLRIISGGQAVYTQNGGLGFGANTIGIVETQGDLVLGENSALTIDVSGGNPTMNGSTSTLDVHVYYKTLTL